MGGAAAVRNVLSVVAHPAESIVSRPRTAALAEHIGKSGKAPLYVLLKVPQDVQDALDTLLELSYVTFGLDVIHPIEWLLRKLAGFDTVGFALSQEGSSLPLELIAIMRNEESAKTVSSTLHLFKGLTAIAPGQPQMSDDQRIQHALAGISVERIRETVLVRASLPILSDRNAIDEGKAIDLRFSAPSRQIFAKNPPKSETSTSPHAAAKLFFMNFMQGRFSEAARYTTRETGEKLRRMKSVGTLRISSDAQFILIEEKITDDTAVVAFKVTPDGKRSELHLIRADGDWKVSLQMR